MKVLTKIYFSLESPFGRKNFFNIFSDMRIMHKVSVLPPHCHCNIGICGVGFGDFPSQAVAKWHSGKLKTKNLSNIHFDSLNESHFTENSSQEVIMMHQPWSQNIKVSSIKEVLKLHVAKLTLFISHTEKRHIKDQRHFIASFNSIVIVF